MRCEYCPIPPGKRCDGATGASPHLCAWAASGDPHKVNSVIERAKFPPPTFVSNVPLPHELTIRTYLSKLTGYGQISEWIGRGLESEGVQVGYEPITVDDREVPIDEFVARRVVPGGGGPLLQIAVPESDVRGGSAVMTMWESSRINGTCVAALNGATQIIVPCRWNAESFTASGVKVPIAVVPFGVDPEEGYTFRPLRPSGPIVFGMAGRIAHGPVRKGLQEGVDAFLDAFPGREDVRLALKVFKSCLGYLKIPNDPRISVVTEPLYPRQMSEWYSAIDCLFVPSKGEGWGLHTLQAMACGRPVIAARFGGTAEFFDAACGWELDYDMGPARDLYAGRLDWWEGEWCVPRHESMVEALRAAYRGGRPVLDYRGRKAAERASTFTWGRTATALHSVLTQIGLVRPKPELPGLFRQAVSYGKALLSHARSGQPVTSERDYRARLRVCETRGPRGSRCENLLLPEWRCAGMVGCGCWLVEKARWGDSECPIGAWPKLMDPAEKTRV